MHLINSNMFLFHWRKVDEADEYGNRIFELKQGEFYCGNNQKKSIQQAQHYLV